MTESRERWLLRQIIEALPFSRDWLDPAIEREAKDLSGATSPAGGAYVRFRNVGPCSPYFSGPGETDEDRDRR